MLGTFRSKNSFIFIGVRSYRFVKVNCYNYLMKLKEFFIKKNAHVHGKAVDFRVDQIRLPNGKKATREYLDHPGAVGVIPLIGKDKVVLVRQYRYPVKEVTWELPAGKLAKGEHPLPCVKRELQEETGYTAKKYKKLIAFWPTAAFANEVIHLYIATGLTSGQNNPDDDEFIDCAIWPLEKAYRAIQTGKIKDSKTIVGLLALSSFPRRRESRS